MSITRQPSQPVQQHRPHRRRRFRVRPEALGLGWNGCTVAAPASGALPHPVVTPTAEPNPVLVPSAALEEKDQERLHQEALQRGTFWGTIVCFGLFLLVIFLALGFAERS